MKAFALLTLMLMTAAAAHGQMDAGSLSDPADRLHSTMIGIGSRNALDTYLSPETYRGTEVRMLHEKLRMTRLMGGNVSVQTMLQGNMAYTKMRSHDGEELSGMMDWTTTWHYRWHVTPTLTLAAGPGVGAHVGFVYNIRSGNNPAQGRLSADINLGGMVLYRMHIKKQLLFLRYQAELPAVGLAFSPNYGQSYYEIFSLGNYDHNVCLTNPLQALTFNQLVTADLPLSFGTLRVGYLCNIRQQKVNHLKQHDWSHLFILGYVKHFQLLK